MEEKRDYISWSQINMWRRCPKQYYWRYERGLIERPGGALLLGSACHVAEEKSGKNYIEKKTHLETVEVVDVFSDTFEQKVDEVGGKKEVEWLEESKDGIKDDGVNMLRLFHPTIGVKAKPKLIEQAFNFELEDGLKVSGIIDRIEEDDAIIDYKTTAKKKPDDSIFKDEQVKLYQLAVPEATKLKQEVLGRRKNKGKNTYFVQELERLPATDEELNKTIENIMDIAEAVKKGVFPKCDPLSYNCSEAYCGFYHTCMG